MVVIIYSSTLGNAICDIAAKVILILTKDNVLPYNQHISGDVGVAS